MQALTGLRSAALEGLAGFWAWWSGELKAALPERLLAWWDRVPVAQVRLHADRTEIEHLDEEVGRRFVDERPLAALDGEAWAELRDLVCGARTTIVLQRPDYLVVDMALPRAARKRLRSAVALHLAHSAPLDIVLLHWSSRVVAADAEGLTVRAVLARRTRLDEIRSLFEHHDIASPPIVVDTDEGRFLLRTGRDAGRLGLSRTERNALVASALLLVSVPFTILAAATLMSGLANDRAALLQEEIAPRLEAERRARAAEQLKSALRPMSSRPSVSRTLDQLAESLPGDAFATRVEQTADRSLTVTASTVDPQAVEAAIAASETFRSIALVDQGAEGERMIATYRIERR